MEDWGTRTKGTDSATFRIQALIARGELHEAETMLVQAIAAGLVAREAATRLQEKIAERKQQQSSPPDRRVSPSNLEDVEVEETERRTCAMEMPDIPVCRELPDGYSFHSARQALEAMKQKLDAKDLSLHNKETTLSGPCPRIGEHYNVRRSGERAGSIVCCPCCAENDPNPLLWKKCRIVW
jgi:hypothetical protein